MKQNMEIISMDVKAFDALAQLASLKEKLEGEKK